MRNDESICLYRIEIAAYSIIAWSSFSALITLIIGAGDYLSGSAVSITIFEAIAFALCASFVLKGRYFLFWIMFFLFIIDTIIVINLGAFSSLTFIIRLGISTLLFLGIASSLKISNITSSNSKTRFNGPKHVNTYNETYENKTPEEEFFNTESEEYYCAILKINSDSSIDEIKRAFKEEIRKYHPDKVEHLGDEFKEIAEKKSKSITRAYNYFRKKFRF